MAELPAFQFNFNKPSLLPPAPIYANVQPSKLSMTPPASPTYEQPSTPTRGGRHRRNRTELSGDFSATISADAPTWNQPRTVRPHTAHDKTPVTMASGVTPSKFYTEDETPMLIDLDAAVESEPPSPQRNHRGRAALKGKSFSEARLGMHSAGSGRSADNHHRAQSSPSLVPAFSAGDFDNRPYYSAGSDAPFVMGNVYEEEENETNVEGTDSPVLVTTNPSTDVVQASFLDSRCPVPPSSSIGSPSIPSISCAEETPSLISNQSTAASAPMTYAGTEETMSTKQQVPSLNSDGTGKKPLKKQRSRLSLLWQKLKGRSQDK